MIGPKKTHAIASIRMSQTPKQPQRPRLSIIIVSYNTLDLLRDCILSILPQLGPHDEVIVVDNASSDGSADMVANHFQNTTLIASNKNLGFGKANNKGISLAKGELIWLLNPDTRLMPAALDKAVGFMSSNSSIGMAGTALIYPDGSPQSSVERRYPGHRYGRPELGQLPGEIAWVMGASIVARRDVLETVGGFDEQFFLYGEEIDLCLMVRKMGWPIGFIEDAVVVHFGGGSERKNPPTAVMEKKFKAEMLFYRKHYSGAIIRKIQRKNRIQAGWRLMTLIPLRLLKPGDATIAAKHDFYRLSWRFFRNK